MRTFRQLASGIAVLFVAPCGRGAPAFASHDREVEALLAQMTLDEIVGQMAQADSAALQPGDVKTCFLGSVLSGGGSDPEHGNTAPDWLAFVSRFQAQALQTRLKILPKS